MSSISASSIQSSSIVPVSGPSMEAKGKRLEKKVHELKVKAQLAKGASTPRQVTVKPAAKPSAQTAGRNAYETKKARLESLVQGLAKNARDSQRQSNQQLRGKRTHSEETAEITGESPLKKVRSSKGKEKSIEPGRKESRLQKACRKEMVRRLTGKNIALGKVKNRDEAFLESFAAGLNALGKAGLLKDRVHPQDSFTIEDIKDLIGSYYRESSTDSGKEKGSYRPEVEGKILAEIFDVRLAIYEVGAYDEGDAVEGNGLFWEQETEYGNPSHPKLMVGLYDGCFAHLTKEASKQQQIDAAALAAQIRPIASSEEIYSKIIWEKEQEDALRTEITRQHTENPKGTLDWVLAAQKVNRTCTKRTFTREQCSGKYVGMCVNYNKRKLKTTWRTEDQLALIEAVKEQKGSEKTDWVLVVEKIKKATGGIFTAIQARDKFKYINPEIKHGAWAKNERLLLIFGKAKHMSFTEISKTLMKGTRSRQQCYEKWNTIKDALTRALVWTSVDDKKLLEGYEKFKNHPKKWLRISETYFNDTKHSQVRCCMRWKYLNRLTREQFVGRHKEPEQISCSGPSVSSHYSWSAKQNELLIFAAVVNDCDWESISSEFFEGVCSKEECEQRYKQLEGTQTFKRIKAKAIKLKEEFHSLFEGSSESETEEEGD